MYLKYFLFLGQRNDERKCYEQQESSENPLRCPVKLYEFYLSKWYVRNLVLRFYVTVFYDLLTLVYIGHNMLFLGALFLEYI